MEVNVDRGRDFAVPTTLTGAEAVNVHRLRVSAAAWTLTSYMEVNVHRGRDSARPWTLTATPDRQRRPTSRSRAAVDVDRHRPGPVPSLNAEVRPSAHAGMHRALQRKDGATAERTHNPWSSVG